MQQVFQHSAVKGGETLFGLCICGIHALLEPTVVKDLLAWMRLAFSPLYMFTEKLRVNYVRPIAPPPTL
jgi:hypothetical protein